MIVYSIFVVGNDILEIPANAKRTPRPHNDSNVTFRDNYLIISIQLLITYASARPEQNQ